MKVGDARQAIWELFHELRRKDEVGAISTRQRFGVLQSSGAFRGPENVRKRRRTGALQDAAACFHPLVSLSLPLAKVSTAWLRLRFPDSGFLLRQPILR